MWKLKASDEPGTLEQRIDRLLAQLRLKGDLFEVIPDLSSARLAVFWARPLTEPQEGSGELALGPRILGDLAARGLQLSIEVFVSDDEAA